MSFQSLQNAYQMQQPTKQFEDPTKELLKQGQNFAKEMAGERGIMAAIEGAHFRPIIQKYIKSKLSDPSGFVNSIKKDVEGVRQTAVGKANRLAATGQQAKQLVKRGGNIIDESLQGAGKRGDPNVGRPPLTDRPIEYGKAEDPQVGQLERETQTGGYGSEPLEAVSKPPSFGEDLRVPRGVDPEGPFENLFPNPPATEEEFGKPILSAAQRARQATTEGGQKLGDVLRGGAPRDEQQRAVPKPTPEPSTPSASTPAVDAPPPPAVPMAPKQITADDFPSVPIEEEAIRPAPQPIEPRGELDEHGLPKLPQEDRAEQQESVGKDVVKEEVKTAPIEEGEAEAPGIGDVLAVGTALYGAIKGAVEAHQARKEAQGYVAPQMPAVAMDSAPSFDSVFRGN
jgi:hypothetical protein